jgi:hypothetical protein
MAKFKKEWSYTSNPSGISFIRWDGWLYSLRKSVRYLVYRELGGPGDCGEQSNLHTDGNYSPNLWPPSP